MTDEAFEEVLGRQAERLAERPKWSADDPRRLRDAERARHYDSDTLAAVAEIAREVVRARDAAQQARGRFEAALWLYERAGGPLDRGLLDRCVDAADRLLAEESRELPQAAPPPRNPSGQVRIVELSEAEIGELEERRAREAEPPPPPDPRDEVLAIIEQGEREAAG